MLRASTGIVSLVGSVSGTDDSGDFTITPLPAGISSGDIGVLIIGSATNESSLITTPTFTELAHNANSGSAHALVRTMDGTETQVAITSGSNLSGTTYIFAVFRGCDEPSTLSTATGASGMPNPGTSPTGVAADWIIATGYLDDDDVTPTVQTNYTLIDALGHTFIGAGSSSMMSYRTGVAGTDDPGVFGGGGTDEWVAYTIRLIKSA